jgi:hypothetical protein
MEIEKQVATTQNKKQTTTTQSQKMNKNNAK